MYSRKGLHLRGVQSSVYPSSSPALCNSKILSEMDCSKVAGDTSKNPLWGLGPNSMEKEGLANTDRAE